MTESYDVEHKIRRGDVIDLVTKRMLSARKRQEDEFGDGYTDDPLASYLDGYQEACTDILDALTGWCHSNYTIKESA